MIVDKYVGTPQHYTFPLTPRMLQVFCYRWEFLRLNESYKKDFKRVNTDKNLGKKVFGCLESGKDLDEIRKKHRIGWPLNPEASPREVIALLKKDNRAKMAIFGLLESEQKCGLLNPIIDHPVLWHGIRGTEITFHKNKDGFKFTDGFQDIPSIEKYKDKSSEINIAIDINYSLDQICKAVRNVIKDWQKINKTPSPSTKTRKHWHKFDEYIKAYRFHKDQGMSYKEIAKKIYKRDGASDQDRVRKDIETAQSFIDGGYRKID